MSKFSDRLNDARGKESIRSVSKRAAQVGDVGESTLHPYFRAEHPRPTMPVVIALAMALNIPSQELRELAGIPPDGQPWMPPPESRFMSDRQRRAVTELIRSFVQTQHAGLGVAAQEVEPRSVRDRHETDPTDSTTSGNQNPPIPTDDTARKMTDDELRQAAEADPLWADYVKSKRPELVEWDF